MKNKFTFFFEGEKQIHLANDFSRMTHNKSRKKCTKKRLIYLLIYFKKDHMLWTGIPAIRR